jgi:hypothetical protein
VQEQGNAQVPSPSPATTKCGSSAEGLNIRQCSSLNESSGKTSKAYSSSKIIVKPPAWPTSTPRTKNCRVSFWNRSAMPLSRRLAPWTSQSKSSSATSLSSVDSRDHVHPRPLDLRAECANHIEREGRIPRLPSSCPPWLLSCALQIETTPNRRRGQTTKVPFRSANQVPCGSAPSLRNIIRHRWSTLSGHFTH